MAVRERPLTTAVVGVGGAANTLVYTVPADRTAIIKDIRLRVDGAGGVADLLAYDPGSGCVQYLLSVNGAGGVAQTEQLGAHVDMTEGMQLYVLRSATTFQASVWVSGPLLAGDPA